MTTALKDMLSALCSRVEPAVSNNSSDIFLLGDAKEARLAYDVLFAHGFEVKLYDEQNASKLYVLRNATAPADVEKRLEAAMAYALALKAMKQAVENLRLNTISNIADYSLTFGSTPYDGKQINISITPPVQAKPAAAAAPPQQRAAVKTQKKAASKKKEDDWRAGGPELGKKYPFSSKTGDNTPASSGRIWLSRFFVQNIAGNGTVILLAIISSLGLVTLFIMSQSVLCPDFAAEKSRAWYCIPNPKDLNKKTIQ